jgi:hypothetical protein
LWLINIQGGCSIIKLPKIRINEITKEDKKGKKVDDSGKQ